MAVFSILRSTSILESGTCIAGPDCPLGGMSVDTTPRVAFNLIAEKCFSSSKAVPFCRRSARALCKCVSQTVCSPRSMTKMCVGDLLSKSARVLCVGISTPTIPIVKPPIASISAASTSSEDRLAAAGRVRSAVALELVAGKVWALPIAVQPARGIRCRNGTRSP